MAKELTLQPFDLSTLPERVRASSFDEQAARDMLALIEANGAASDLKGYETSEKARNAGIRYSRALSRVLPDGDTRKPTIRTFGIDAKGKPTAMPSQQKTFGFVVSLREQSADSEAGDAATA